MNKSKKEKQEEGHSSCGRGRGRGRDQGRGRSQLSDEQKQDGQRKMFDKSKVRCYNCQEFGHFSYECKNKKKPRVCEESMNLKMEESNLFMAFTEDVLLQGVQEMDLQDNLWYLDTWANSYMTSKRSFHSIDENQHGLIQFGDESSVMFEGKGSIVVNYPSGGELNLEGVLYVSSLKVNILSLGKLDDDDFTSTLGGGFLSISENEGRKFAKIQKTGGSMYLLKMGDSEFCHLTREEGVWLWHHRLCYQNFRHW